MKGPFVNIRVAFTAVALLLNVSLQVTSLQMLEPFSTLYLPSRYRGESPEYEYGGDAIEDAAIDTDNNLVYTAGDAFINIIDISAMKSPAILHHQAVQADTPVVSICGEYVTFLSKSLIADHEDGAISIYKKYDRAKPGVFEMVKTIPVGPEPESVAFTQDCRVAVVANAAAPNVDWRGTDIIDPEGSVSIIEFMNGDMSREPQNNTKVDFTSFNNRSEEYVNRGVRFVYNGQLSTRITPTLFSQSMTPEYVVLNNQGTKAYVCLQINNAVAVIDIASRSVDDIYALGAKLWTNLDMDVSDQDGGIKFGRWPIKTLYQPDEIRYFETADGRGYIITANEGDPFKVKLTTPRREWTDAKQGGEFTVSELSPTLDARVRSALNDSATLGNHEFSTMDGFDLNGRIKKLHGFGGRGISVFRVSDFQQVYDSGDSVAKLHAKTYPEVFNADDEPDNLTPRQLMDLRSTKQGVDCESLALGEIDGVRLVFVGADRSGTLMVFSLRENSFEPKLEYVYRNGSTDLPISQLFTNRDLNDAAPEALTFIPANKNSAGRFPMLMVAGTESGTLSFYRINYTGSSGAVSIMTSVASRFGFVTWLSIVTVKYLL